MYWYEVYNDNVLVTKTLFWKTAARAAIIEINNCTGDDYMFVDIKEYTWWGKVFGWNREIRFKNGKTLHLPCRYIIWSKTRNEFI